MKVLSNNQCKKDYSYPSYLITSNMLCDYVEGGGKDSCQVLMTGHDHDVNYDDVLMCYRGTRVDL